MKHLNKEIQICTQNKDRTDYLKDKHIQKIQTQYTEHWIKNRTTQNKKTGQTFLKLLQTLTTTS